MPDSAEQGAPPAWVGTWRGAELEHVAEVLTLTHRGQRPSEDESRAALDTIDRMRAEATPAPRFALVDTASGHVQLRDLQQNTVEGVWGPEQRDGAEAACDVMNVLADRPDDPIIDVLRDAAHQGRLPTPTPAVAR